MSVGSRLTEALTAPARFFRYLTHPPGGTYAERYEAMSEEEKAERRYYQATKRDSAYRVFPSPFGERRKPPKGRGTP